MAEAVSMDRHHQYGTAVRPSMHTIFWKMANKNFTVAWRRWRVFTVVFYSILYNAITLTLYLVFANLFQDSVDKGEYSFEYKQIIMGMIFRNLTPVRATLLAVDWPLNLTHHHPVPPSPSSCSAIHR